MAIDHGFRRGALVASLALTVSLLASACGEVPVDQAGSRPVAATGQPPGQPSLAAAQITPPSDPTSSPSPTRKKKKRNIISWILSLGPGAPIGPPEFTAYRELQQFHCATVVDRVGELQPTARTLYTGASRACLAAFAGRPRMWRRASAAYDSVSRVTGDLTCMDQAAYVLLRRLVVKHRRHPDRAFRRAPATESTAPPCPRNLMLAPDHGPAGTTVLLTGTDVVDNVAGVDIADSLGSSVPVDFTVTAEGGLQLVMPEAPPPDESSIVCLVVRAEPDWDAAGALFSYEGNAIGPATPVACPPVPTS